MPSVSPSSDGSETSPYYYVYEYRGNIVCEAKTSSKYMTYGVLYNWEAAKTVCPTGWRLPSDDEWKILEKYLGMSQSDADAISTSSRMSGSVGKKLKSTSGWDDNGNGNNSTGFNALPGGFRFIFTFVNLGGSADFWTSSMDGSDTWDRNIYKDDGMYRGSSMRSDGCSVRCLRD